MGKVQMQRREFLQSLAAGGMTALTYRGLHRTAAAEPEASPKPFLLSTLGCGRATGYSETNKIITVGDKTHVAWLDSPPDGFRVRVRTLDRRTGQWSPTHTVGEAYDNHGGPALTVDSEGYLHIAYYPHHHPFRYRKSKRPNDASAWEEEMQFGQRCTYPTLVCGPDNTLYFTCRRSFSDRPWHVELWTKRPGGDWQGPVPIARSRHRGYAHFQESLAWGPDHQRLHLCCRFYERGGDVGYGPLQTVGYMFSDDLGKTWRRSDGSLIELPATPETMERLASGCVDAKRELRAGAMGVDAKGAPHVIYTVREEDRGTAILATRGGDGGWRRTALSAHLPEPWTDWNLVVAGGVAFHGQEAMTIAAQVQQPVDRDDTWGNSTNEVVSFRSADHGNTFHFSVVSEPDRRTSHWLPNIERMTGHNQVPDRCGVIYTAGPPGEKNTDLLSNKVFWSQAQ